MDCNLGCRPEDTLNAEAGHARIMTPLGEILAETRGWGEDKIVADLDPQASIAGGDAPHTGRTPGHAPEAAGQT